MHTRGIVVQSDLRLLLSFLLGIFLLRILGQLSVQIVADLVDLSVVLVSMIVGTVLQCRYVRVVADERVEAASAVILLWNRLCDRLEVLF